MMSDVRHDDDDDVRCLNEETEKFTQLWTFMYYKQPLTSGYGRLRTHVLFSSQYKAGRAVRLEFWITFLKERQKLLHHAADVVAVDQGKAQLHSTPASTTPTSVYDHS